MSVSLPSVSPSLPAPGEERRSHHLPRPRTAGLLPHPQHETAQGTLLPMVCVQPPNVLLPPPFLTLCIVHPVPLLSFPLPPFSLPPPPPPSLPSSLPSSSSPPPHLNQLGVREYVCSLERAVIATCSDFGVPAHTTEHTGVWVGDQKISALGEHNSLVHVHGFI